MKRNLLLLILSAALAAGRCLGIAACSDEDLSADAHLQNNSCTFPQGIIFG